MPAADALALIQLAGLVSRSLVAGDAGRSGCCSPTTAAVRRSPSTGRVTAEPAACLDPLTPGGRRSGPPPRPWRGRPATALPGRG